MTKAVKAIKAVYCTSVRKRVFISIHTKIVQREVVPILDSAHCRYHTMHGCDHAQECERIDAAYDQWVNDGMSMW